MLGLIIEDCGVEGKNSRGRLRQMEYMQQIVKDRGCNCYEETKKKASNRKELQLLRTNLGIEYNKETTFG